ncbi:MAG: hypothetical protein ACRYFX_02950 [Janthinobacterium lividum]
MKSFLQILLLSGGLTACKTSASAPGQPASPPVGKAAPSQDFRLPFQQATTLTVPGGRVQATLTEVQESRCPQNVTCISAGVVAITLTLTDMATTQMLHLARGPHQADSVALTLNKQAYWLRLLDVTPYPSDTNNGSEPEVAALRLRRGPSKPAVLR